MSLYGLLPLGSQPVASALLGSNSILPQQGAFTKSHTVALSGSAVTVSAGTAKPDRSKALDAGSEAFPLVAPYTSIISARGSVTYVVLSSGDIEVFLGGEEITVEDESVSPDRSKALDGSEAASGHGTLVPGIIPTTLVTQLIQPEAGTLVWTQAGEDVTVNINAGEMEMSSFTGNIGTASPLSGHAITTAAGSFGVTNVPTDTLLGQSFTAEQSSVAVQQDVEDTFIGSGIGSIAITKSFALTGAEAVFEQGTITATGDVTIALTGEDLDVEIGEVTDSYEFPLTGQEILGEQDNSGFGLPKNIELTGAEALAEAGNVFLDNDRSYPLTTAVSNTEMGTLPAFVNAFVNGETITTEQENIGPRNVDLTGEQVAVEQGRIKAKDKNEGGKPKPDKPKKGKKVLIDDEIFYVKDDAEAEELFKQVLALAAEKAKADADAIVAKALADKDKEAKVSLTVPRISDEELQKQVADIYTQATIDAQVNLEVSRRRQLDEEEALVLLLLN